MAAERTRLGWLADHGKGLCPAVGVIRLMMMALLDADVLSVLYKFLSIKKLGSTKSLCTPSMLISYHVKAQHENWVMHLGVKFIDIQDLSIICKTCVIRHLNVAILIVDSTWSAG